MSVSYFTDWSNFPAESTPLKYWASADPSKTNKDCINDQTGCITQEAKVGQYINAELIPVAGEPTCWTQWIHGYDTIDADAKHAHIGQYVENTHGPADCQQRCQDDKDCVYWSYKANVSGSGATGDIGFCLLKTIDMMKEAQNIFIYDAQAQYDIAWCNSMLRVSCTMENGYNCKACEDGVKRCIYQSVNHIAGPKFCNDLKDECAWNPGGPTPDPNHPTHPPTEAPITQPNPTGNNPTQPAPTGGHHTHHDNSTGAAGGGSNAGLIAGSVVGGAAVLGAIAAAITVFHGGSAAGAAAGGVGNEQPDFDREAYVEVDASQFA